MLNKTTLLALCVMAVAIFQGRGETPKVIAHQGYWQTEGSANNSVRSLIKADSIGCYGSEFDVMMTSDGVLVVNHGPTINGMPIENTDSKTILAQKLANGENIPTFDAFLNAAQDLSCRLICELKIHDKRSTEVAAVKEIVALVKKYGLEDRTDFITFSPDALRAFIAEAPEQCSVYFLEGYYVPAQLKSMGASGIDYHISILKNHPEWITQAHDLGLKVNIWTVDDEEGMLWCINNGADFITTNKPELLQSVLKNHSTQSE